MRSLACYIYKIKESRTLHVFRICQCFTGFPYRSPQLPTRIILRDKAYLQNVAPEDTWTYHCRPNFKKCKTKCAVNTKKHFEMANSYIDIGKLELVFHMEWMSGSEVISLHNLKLYKKVTELYSLAFDCCWILQVCRSELYLHCFCV